MRNKKGFTLIELLVVVLIIGILAGIALPQYRKAVARSQATRLQTLVSSLVPAIQSYYLIHDEYPTSFEDIDIDVAWPYAEENICNISVSGEKAIKQDGDLQIALNMDEDSIIAVVLGMFISGPYQCTGFAYFFKGEDVPLNQLICQEASYSRGSKDQQGDFCEKIMNKTYYNDQYHWWQFD